MSPKLAVELLTLIRNQWKSEDRLREIQLAKLRHQLQRAFDYSPFYKSVYGESGFRPEDLRSLDDLAHLPIVTKADITAAGEDTLCTDIAKSDCAWLKTSGTSGTATKVPFTPYDRAHRVLKELRALFALGYKPTDKMTILRIPTDMIIKNDIMAKMGIFRRSYVSSNSDPEAQIFGINQHNPHVLYGYTSNLRILADRLAYGDMEKPRPKIIVAAADLLDRGTSDVIHRQFGVQPVDFYGAMEFGWIGWQCKERNGYHINSDCCIVECLKNGKPVRPGEEGEIVITNLHSNAAPFIRYATGDMGIMAKNKCACGRTLPVLTSLSGRIIDFIVSPEGKAMSPYLLTVALTELKGIRRFQIVQTAVNSITVNIVPDECAPGDEIICQSMRKLVGREMKVNVVRTGAVAQEPNGKFKMVKSLLSPNIIRQSTRVAS